MTVEYQLDKCSDSRRLFAGCIAEGKARVFRFRSLATADSTPDPQIFSLCQDRGRVLLTMDATFHDDNQVFLPELHQGLVIVSNAGSKGLTIRDAMTTLERFKANYAQWDRLGPTNSILQITQEWVEVSIISGRRVRTVDHIRFDRATWLPDLDAILADQRRRGSMPTSEVQAPINPEEQTPEPPI